MTVKKIKAPLQPKTIAPIELNEAEKSLLTALVQRERTLSEEAQRIRASVSTIATVIAGRAGVPIGTRLNLNVDAGTITVAEV
jgi:hypothetical protein